jgi:hypothetical protein
MPALRRREFISLLGGAAMADKYGLLDPRAREASPLVWPVYARIF